LDYIHNLCCCCPNLQQLQFGAPLPNGVDLALLMQLQQLTLLLLSTPFRSPLASLTGLKQLTLHTSQLPDVALLQLTALTGLEKLLISVVRGSYGFQGMSKALQEAVPGGPLPPGAQRTRLLFQHKEVSCAGGTNAYTLCLSFATVMHTGV
jgi:hypothetical protein